jgi:uncharacterized protein YyaL (SSP411 family)
MPNHLIHESSPYLLQHAHNPVDWYPWGEEALGIARREDKPILVSIGYAACHWCHVMERESFEDPETAAFMNAHFVNIKIDREERPDLDHIYMDAVQAISGSGGWPLNVFLTPEAKPFYGGTYFPPRPAYNRGSWMDVLKAVSESYRDRREEMHSQAENLTAHLLGSNDFGLRKNEPGQVFTAENAAAIARNILQSADREWGGFGRAPKFPQTFSLRYLLRFSSRSRQEGGDPALEKDAMDQALFSLDKMTEGGIYDQAGGGFARYSTDTEWLAPHFEKMLYDNALLLAVLSEAFLLTGRERYREIIMETMDFIQREMLHPSGGFYSALDADSEGVEGKFYVWDRQEIEEILGADADIFCDYYDVTDKGNWEHKNILRVLKPLEVFAKEKMIGENDLKKLLKRCREKVLAAREKRIRPLLDDKIILGWNALMNSAASQAFAATGIEAYRKLAVQNMNFLLDNFRDGDDGDFFHTWKNGEAKVPAFLDDLAFLVRAMLDLQEITGETKWLDEASRVASHVIGHFSEKGGPFFFYTKSGQQDVIVRKKEVYDGALPSGNAMMAGNLWHLAILLDQRDWSERAIEMASALSVAVTRYPTSFGQWADLLQEIVYGTREIALTGKGAGEVIRTLLQQYVPHRVLMWSEKGEKGYPLIDSKPDLGRPAIWLCRNYTCAAPVFSVGELISLINKGANR